MIYSIFIPGSVLEFVELKDQEDRTLCEFLAANIGQGGAINSYMLNNLKDLKKMRLVFQKKSVIEWNWNWKGIGMELKWN